MSDGLDRKELISLLETLGSDDDEEALAAARALSGKVAAAGASWDELLAATDPGAETPEETESAEPARDLGELGDLESLPADTDAKNAESLALIEKLLARGAQTETLRQELEGYKQDIAAGEFTDSDHRYIRALCKRLSA
jgi:hypothetical protein